MTLTTQQPNSEPGAMIAKVVSVCPMPGGHLDVVLDVDRPSAELELSEARLIGRTSKLPACKPRVRVLGEVLRQVSKLPDDIAVGDLVAIPCRPEPTPQTRGAAERMAEAARRDAGFGARTSSVGR